MELGGSDPFIVRHDADVDLAVELLIKSRIPNAGQICFSAKRMIVHASLYDTLLSKLILRLEALKNEQKIGDPMDDNVMMGPLARQDILELLESQVQLIQDSGCGQIKYGGKRIDSVQCKDGFFYEPTIIEADSSKIADPSLQEELFGPVFTL